MTDKLTTGPTVEEQIRHQEYSVHAAVAYNDDAAFNKEAAILDSLRELQSIRSAELPVEPDVVKRIRIAGQSDTLLSVIEYIDALKAKLQAAQQELLDTTWQDHADHWKKRAEQAEKDRDACYASLEATRSKLHEITAFVNDNASPQRESEQERDAFARAIDKLTAGCGQVNHHEFKEPCFWIQDSDGVWNSSCEHSFEFNDGGPDENKAKFCMYCGLHLAAQPYEADK